MDNDDIIDLQEDDVQPVETPTTPEPATPEAATPRPFLRLPPSEPKRKKWEPRGQRDQPFETLPRYTPEGRDSNTGRTPPHSIEAEEYLLSCCFLDGADIVGRCLNGRITAKSFYVPKNQTIFEQLESLYVRKLPIDLQVLAQELAEHRLLEQIGGYAYLTQISSRIPTTAQSAYFIEKVRELHTLRELIKVATGAVEGCYDYDGGLEEFVEKVQRDLFTVTQDSTTPTERLAKCRVIHALPPPSAKVILSIAGKPVSTQGNLTAIIAQAKAGKTTFVGGALTAILKANGDCEDCADSLGWHAVPTNGAVCLYFDTELSPHDHWTMLDRVARRAKCETMPPWLENYCVTGWKADEIRKIVRITIENVLRRGRKIYAVILDGVADLCLSVNDDEESGAVVAELHSFAIAALAPIICVMHRNEGDKADSAARGHLGKQLARKAETNLRLEQKEEISFVFADRNRGAPIKHDEGPAFQWDSKCFMHKSITQAQKEQFHRDHEDDSKKKKPKREPREPRPEPVRASDQKWTEEEVASLFPFGERVRMPLPQIQKMAESQLLMPAKLFATYRFNLLTGGLIQKHSDGMYYR